MPLTRMHAILQTAFGWHDERRHRFTAAGPYGRLKPVNGEIVEPPQWLPVEFCDAPTDHPEEECSLDDLLKAADGTAFHEYDFGDSWLHRLDLTSRRRPSRQIHQHESSTAPEAACSKTPEGCPARIRSWTRWQTHPTNTMNKFRGG